VALTISVRTRLFSDRIRKNDEETKKKPTRLPAAPSMPLVVYTAILRTLKPVVCSFLSNCLDRFTVCGLRTKKLICYS
jgi:hypothetical protein